MKMSYHGRQGKREDETGRGLLMKIVKRRKKYKRLIENYKKKE